ncbi:hypothetical protein GCM10011573_00160 [Enterococcus wangshanyuanii]|uniref:Uncharacterized protein n=1 Tax=Enterococcus wangshanyuanii TaxID=2005703 RepID=A0ABQ1NEI7_9ENTE|nr:hypothetical protein GCM10011573_00160 [Enterococcus wangshanyuanii]
MLGIAIANYAREIIYIHIDKEDEYQGYSYAVFGTKKYDAIFKTPLYFYPASFFTSTLFAGILFEIANSVYKNFEVASWLLFVGLICYPLFHWLTCVLFYNLNDRDKMIMDCIKCHKEFIKWCAFPITIIGFTLPFLSFVTNNLENEFIKSYFTNFSISTDFKYIGLVVLYIAFVEIVSFLVMSIIEHVMKYKKEYLYFWKKVRFTKLLFSIVDSTFTLLICFNYDIYMELHREISKKYIRFLEWFKSIK